MSSRPGLGERLRPLVTQPWAGLAAAFGGGLAWAAGVVPVVGGVGVGAAMLAAAAGAMALMPGRPAPTREPEISLRPDTEQARIIDALDLSLAQLQAIRRQDLPAELQTSAVDAITAADGARSTALHVARAIDTLDEAIRQGALVQSHSGTGSSSMQATIARLTARRHQLLQRLALAVDQVTGLYARMLELSATVDTLDVSPDVTSGDIGAVNDSLTALQETFAELEADAAKERPGGGAVPGS